MEIEKQHHHIIKRLGRWVDEIKKSSRQKDKDQWYIYERNINAMERVILKVLHTKEQGKEHIDVIAHQVGLSVWISEDGNEIEIEFGCEEGYEAEIAI